MRYDPAADADLLSSHGRTADAARLARPARSTADPLQARMGCPPPIWMNSERNKRQDGGCVFFSGDRRCPATATHWAWIGCTIGEHLDKSGVCESHSQAMARLPVLHCQRCWDAIGQVSDAQIIEIEVIDGEA